MLGVASPVVEIELILATSQALAQLGLSDLTVRINDRRLLALIARHCGIAEAAQAKFFIVFDKLDKIGADGVIRELRESGHDTVAVARFEQLLPTLQKGEPALDALRTSLGEESGQVFDWLRTIIGTASRL